MVIYSKSVKAIAEDLHITIERAQEVHDAVMTAFPQLAKWVKETQQKVKKDGFIVGMFGRKRRLPILLKPDYEIKFPQNVNERTKSYYSNIYLSKLNKTRYFKEINNIISEAKNKGVIIINNASKKVEAERQIVNSCIQGSAADVCKKIIIAIGNNKRLQELDCKLELSIHDEQIVTCKKQDAYEVSKILEKITADSTGDTPIKLEVDIAISDVWYGEEYTFDENHQLIKKP